MGGASHTSKPMKKMEEIIGDFAERTCNTNVLFAHVFRLHFGIHGEFMPFFKRLYACGSSRVSFAIDCLGNMSDSFEPNLVEGMEELYFGAGCFITTSGTCVHSSGCHHGKRAEVQKIPVRFCECFSENGFRHLPHTTEVFLDFRDFLHQSRFCEAFSRRHHPLSQMAVKRIVKKCRHCL